MLNSFLTIKDILAGYKRREFSSKEVFDLCYKNISKSEGRIGAFVTLLDREGLKLSRNSIPVGHKDIFSTKNIETTASSNILKGYKPPYDASTVKRLSDKNFVCIGKLNCDAFAHGATGENSDMKVTKNPYDLTRTPGGSSCGPAAAVASGFVLMATATDTGGSIRLPSSFTNTVGIKPTYGRVSRYGVIAMTSSTDSIGHITRTVWDNAYVLGITAGFDPKDATSSHREVDDYLDTIEQGILGLKVGVPREYLENIPANIKDRFYESIKLLEGLGAKVVDVSLPSTKYAINAYYIITPSEISSNLARFDGIRFGGTRNKFGGEAKRRIMMGTFSLSAGYYDEYYLKAQKARTLIIEDFKNAFEKVDVLVTPVSPILPPKLNSIIKDTLKTYMMDVLTVPVSIAGVPSLSVPGGFIDDEGKKLPFGIQLIGNYFNEKLLYRIGYALEQETRYYETTPAI